MSYKFVVELYERNGEMLSKKPLKIEHFESESLQTCMKHAKLHGHVVSIEREDKHESNKI